MAKAAKTVDEYIEERSEAVRSVLQELRALVHAAIPNAAEVMKWGAPVFVNGNNKPVVYLYGGRDHANLGFLHGTALDDPDGLLEGRGAWGRHVKLFPGKELPEMALTGLLGQCANI